MNKSKRTNKQQTEDATNDAKYHWEFLRRCDKYKSDFEEFSRKYGEEGPACGFDQEWEDRECHKVGEDPKIPAPGCFKDRFMKDRYKFRFRWGIDPIPPGFPRSPFLGERIGWISENRQYQSQHTGHGSPHEITLSIDLRGPEAELMKVLRAWIRMEKTRKGITSKRMNRKRFDMYDGYLLAFDLAQQGKTCLEIAQDPTMLSQAKEKNVVLNDKRVLEYKNKAALLITKVRNGTW